MVSMFNVSLDPCLGDGGYYTPGSVVSGVLRMGVDAPSPQFHRIDINFKGVASYSLEENTGKSTVTIKNSKQYFNMETTVWTKKSDPDLLLRAGRYEFPFQFTFPTDGGLPDTLDCPSRSAERIGSIQYTVEARISKHIFSAARLPFHEVVPIDPSFLRPPQTYENHSTAHYLCCVPVPVVVKVDLPKSAFYAGETIPATISVVNSSRLTIFLSASFVKEVTYINHSFSRSDFTSIAVSDRGPPTMQPRSMNTWTTSDLVIPSLTPPSNLTSEVIKLKYSLKVKWDTWWGLGSNTYIPIILIGNVQQSYTTSSASITAKPDPGFSDDDPPPPFSN